ncbi:hypothetical protein BpHYR1_025967 [Brachionus plicatilis]|uniref:Uncharacterized protein n=1 Tax=Brachionus plicatilis TaxID=10195 RepID=A0A3M7SMY1_BRAPC|nr:hypothetical protein BpHYR1_025967 [Brachionus plicatilis]
MVEKLRRSFKIWTFDTFKIFLTKGVEIFTLIWLLLKFWRGEIKLLKSTYKDTFKKNLKFPKYYLTIFQD